MQLILKRKQLCRQTEGAGKGRASGCVERINSEDGGFGVKPDRDKEADCGLGAGRMIEAVGMCIEG